MKARLFTSLAAATLSAWMSGNANAGSMIANASDAQGRSASAVFERVGDQLVVTVTNLTAYDAASAQDVLTKVYFSAGSLSHLQARGAVLGAGSQVLNGASPANGNVGDHWSFSEGKKANKKTGSQMAIGAGNPGASGKRTRSASAQGAKSVGGLDFGIVSASDNPATGDTSLTGIPLIQNRVSFVLSGLPGGFDPSQLGKVTFQFGTRKSDPRLVGALAATVESFAEAVNRVLPGDVQTSSTPLANMAPAPSPLAAGLALMGLLVCGRRRLHLT